MCSRVVQERGSGVCSDWGEGGGGGLMAGTHSVRHTLCSTVFRSSKFSARAERNSLKPYYLPRCLP